MNLSKFIVTCAGILFLILSHQLFAAECSAVFPDAIATHGNGVGNSQINFGYNARLINNPDTVLSTRSVSHNSGSNIDSCGSADCTASNNSAETVSVNFRRGNGSVNYNPPSNQTTTFGARGVNNYRNINARSNATLQFSDSFDVYFFENLSLGSNNTLNLSAGKAYYFRRFSTSSGATINVVGVGTANVFIDSNVSFTSTTLVNSTGVNQGGDASKLVMHVDGNVTFGSNSTYTGALYARNIDFISASYLFGVASGRKVNINSNSILTYDNSVFDADFGDLCDSTPSATVMANFQFDECAYTGTGNEVIDQLGNYSGTSHNSLNTSDDAQIEKALGISSAQHHVQVSIPLPETFSVSTWFKKPTDSSGSRYFILGAMASGGDLLYIDRDNGWRWGIYDAGAGTSLDGSYSFSNLDNNWHHMAVVYKDEQSHLYIDGSFVETINLAPSGTLKYIGTSFDDFGTSTPQGFRAPLDEFIVFDGALTAEEISSIYNYQNTGNNYDGGARTSVQCAQLIAQFSMDELSWEGMSGVVIDELGSYNANAINGPVTSDVNRAISDNPGTCGYGVFDGVNDYVELPSSFENLQDSFTITAWINPSNLDSGSRIFADDENNQGGYALSLGDQRNGNGHLRFYSRRVSPVSLDTSAGEIPTDTWSFVTAVHDSVAKTRRIYINGVERASGTYTGNWGTDTGPASIGGETDDGEINNRFTGSIDEVHVFKGALTATEINEVYAKTHACAEPVIHHYEIVHDGNGLTCAAEPITIKACTNSDCSSLSTESVSLDFNVNGVRKDPVTFIGSTDLNDPTFSFNHTTAETVTLSIANATVNASNAFECSGFGSSCEMTFAETGFQFLADGVVNNINTQLSGKPSNIDFNNQRISLQAIKTNPVTGACEAAFTNDVEIEFVAECIDPSSCAGRKVAINNVPISTADDADTQSIFTNIALGFGDNANNTADIILSYPDAGKVQLHARYNIPVDGVPSGNYMLGNSNTLSLDH